MSFEDKALQANYYALVNHFHKGTCICLGQISTRVNIVMKISVDERGGRVTTQMWNLVENQDQFFDV